MLHMIIRIALALASAHPATHTHTADSTDRHVRALDPITTTFTDASGHWHKEAHHVAR